jgi:glucose-1-phosphate cytidylyltransferase
MKTIILAGGFGTRLSEYTDDIPKPMVRVGPHPMLWHIMNIYAHHGHKEFLLALGYKAGYVKNYFMNYYTLESDFYIDMVSGKMTAIETPVLDWRVGLFDTGLNTMTGGRIRRLAHIVGDGTFLATYGDGVADIDINEAIRFHKAHGKLVTMSVARPAARFGTVDITPENRVVSFKEKPAESAGWVNCGFFVIEPEFLDYLAGDETILEREPLEKAAEDGQLMAYHHPGFWRPMDMKKDVDDLNKLWNSGKAPWKVWRED